MEQSIVTPAIIQESVKEAADLETVCDALDWIVPTLIEEAGNLVIVDNDGQDAAIAMNNSALEINKILSVRRLAATKPHRDEAKRINDLYNGYAAQLDGASKKLKRVLMKYSDECERILRETEAKAAQARQDAEDEQKLRDELDMEHTEEEAVEADEAVQGVVEEAVVARDNAAKTVRSDVGKVTRRLTWTADVEDESQVPREYMVVSQKLIDAAMHRGVRNIDGVKIWQKPSISTGR